MEEREIRISETAESAANDAADLVREALAASDRTLSLAVSGGSTAALFFDALASVPDREALTRLEIFWVDERCVPPDDPESNYGNAKKAIASLGIPEEQIHRMRGEDDPGTEAARYESLLGSRLHAGPLGPAFDLIFLGMGDDGHTASVFPGNDEIFRSRRLVTTAVKLETGQQRITLTPRCINNGLLVFFLVTGSGKAETVRRVLLPKNGEEKLPAARIRVPRGRLVWVLDEKAAGELQKA